MRRGLVEGHKTTGLYCRYFKRCGRPAGPSFRRAGQPATQEVPGLDNDCSTHGAVGTRGRISHLHLDLSYRSTLTRRAPKSRQQKNRYFQVRASLLMVAGPLPGHPCSACLLVPIYTTTSLWNRPNDTRRLVKDTDRPTLLLGQASHLIRVGLWAVHVVHAPAAVDLLPRPAQKITRKEGGGGGGKGGPGGVTH